MSDAGLGREQIVQAAVELLDADGIAGLSMRRLGARLGSGATSAYWHVGNKDNLIALAADAMVAELDLPDPDQVGWRASLDTSARGLRDLILRHRWLPGAFTTYSGMPGPGIARFQNHTLVVCENAGFVGDDADWAGSTVFAFVLGSVSSAAAPTRLDPELLDTAKATVADYPRLLLRYDHYAAAEPDRVQRDSFTFGLDAVLDGLAARLAEARPSP